MISFNAGFPNRNLSLQSLQAKHSLASSTQEPSSFAQIITNKQATGTEEQDRQIKAVQKIIEEALKESGFASYSLEKQAQQDMPEMFYHSILTINNFIDEAKEPDPYELFAIKEYALPLVFSLIKIPNIPESSESYDRERLIKKLGALYYFVTQEIPQGTLREIETTKRDEKAIAAIINNEEAIEDEELDEQINKVHDYIRQVLEESGIRSYEKTGEPTTEMLFDARVISSLALGARGVAGILNLDEIRHNALGIASILVKDENNKKDLGEYEEDYDNEAIDETNEEGGPEIEIENFSDEEYSRDFLIASLCELLYLIRNGLESEEVNLKDPSLNSTDIGELYEMTKETPQGWRIGDFMKDPKNKVPPHLIDQQSREQNEFGILPDTSFLKDPEYQDGQDPWASGFDGDNFEGPGDDEDGLVSS